MEKMFIKSKEKHYIKRYSGKYFAACLIEITGIILWSLGLYEIYFKNKSNPAMALVNIGGLLFVIGSFIFAKVVKVN